MSNIVTTDTDMNPLADLYGNLEKILSTLVVKFSCEADKYETFENRKYSDSYIAAMKQTDSFEIYDYTEKEFKDVGVNNDDIIQYYKDNESRIPANIQEKLLANRRAFIIKNYDEPNDYYRILNGLPPKDTIGGTIVTRVMNESLLVVKDDDSELFDDFTSMRITESTAYNIMGNNLFYAGNHIHISSALIQKEKTSYSRSLLIVPDDYPADKGSKVAFLRDVKSIFYSLGEDVPGDDVVGLYFHSYLNDTIDTTTYFKYSYLVVDDNDEKYDDTKMIKKSEALLNNKNVSIGDYLLLGDYHYVTDEIHDLYGISKKVPLHKIGEYYGGKFVNILEGSGYLNTICKNFPDEKYLEFIGSKKVDILTARAAKNFDILYMNGCDRDVIAWIFSIAYNGARDYFVNTVYNYYYRSIYDYYDNFIGLAIIQMALDQTVTRAMKTAIDRDFYDENLVRMLFEMYDVPYFPNLPEQTQRRLVKNLNYLIQNKATTGVIYDIAAILGYHDINVYKYYLVKEREFDSNYNLIYKDSTTVEPTLNTDGTITDQEVIINDLETMYDLYFQKVDIEEINFQNALTDESKRVDYHTITLEDPLWWDDSDTFDEVYGDYEKYTADTEPDAVLRHYNYRETKYLGVSISYKMSEVLYENIILLKMIFDKKDEISDLSVTLPKITGSMEVSLFDLVVYLCALISKQYHLRGEILTRYSSVMDVMGYINENIDGYRPCDTLVFNFNILTNAETYKEVIEKPSRYLRPGEREMFFNYLSVLTLNQSSVKDKIDAINQMYQNIKGLGYFIGRKMSEADNLFEYRAWKDFYDALFIGQENAEMFKLGNTDRVAETYAEYLQVMNPTLYNTLVDLDETHTYSYIDHVIARLELIVHNLKTLYTVNDSNSALLNYLIKLIKFFKSYTTDLVDFTTEYIFDMRPDNLFKLVEYYKIHHVIVPRDRYRLMYSDALKIIEKTKEIDRKKYEDFIMKMSMDTTLMDVHSINHINCTTCKNFNNCRHFCHNDRETCNGVFREGLEYYNCKFYKYDTSEFLNYIDHYRDLLLSVDYGVYEDIKASVRSHLRRIYVDYKLIDDYNVYSGEEFKYSTEKMKDLLYTSLDRVNELLDLHGFDIEISETGIDGVCKWIDLLTTEGSDVKRICGNRRYPCKYEGVCHYRDEKETLSFIEYFNHDDYHRLTCYVEFYSKLWVDGGHLFTKDEIEHIIETVLFEESSTLVDKEYFDLKKVIRFDDNTIRYMDTFKDVSKEDIIDDSMKFREYLVMYEES